mmetsp:Transcript_16970/g.36931  ORF Transcript_16970/g.36931 Transcript_16970/m.36931 type:complete len:92 (+) Transcript_16970:2354-2629(+)
MPSVDNRSTRRKLVKKPFDYHLTTFSINTNSHSLTKISAASRVMSSEYGRCTTKLPKPIPTSVTSVPSTKLPTQVISSLLQCPSSPLANKS